MTEWFHKFAEEFSRNFIVEQRWKWLLDGLANTLIITFFAVLIGIVIGVVIAMVRSTYDKNKERLKKQKGIGYYLLAFFNAICNIYPVSYTHLTLPTKA